MFLGYRISEILALTIGHVVHRGTIRDRVALPPRFLKGKRGSTRTVPIGQELRRALKRYLFQRAGRGPLKPNDPLFFSPRGGADGQPHAIRRSMAQKIIKKALSRIASEPQGVSSHSLRKSWGLRLYEASGHDLMIVRDGLGHRSVAVTQIYLPTSADRMEACMRQTDWTHRLRAERSCRRGRDISGGARARGGRRDFLQTPLPVIGEMSILWQRTARIARQCPGGGPT